jgi:hypothetical protein
MLRAQAVGLERPADAVVGAQEGEQQGLAGDRLLAGQLTGELASVVESTAGALVKLQVGSSRWRRRRISHPMAVGGVIQAGAHHQEGGPAFFFFKETMQQVERLDAGAPAGAGVPLGGLQGAGDGGSQVGKHESPLLGGER